MAAVLGDIVIGGSAGEATVTVTKGDCAPAVCRVHVLPRTVLTLPAGLTVVEEGAFEGVPVTCIVLPGNVEEIGAFAFANCPRLMQLAIPSGVTQIGAHAFDNDPLLTLLVAPDSYAEQYCIDNGLPYLCIDD